MYIYFLWLPFVFLSVDGEVFSDCGCSSGGRSSISSKLDIDSITPPKNDKNIASQLKEDMVLIERREGFVGSDKPVIFSDGESPKRRVELDSYYIDKYAVTNQGNFFYINKKISY